MTWAQAVRPRATALSPSVVGARRPRRIAVLAALPLSGCWALAWDVDAACSDVPVVTRGAVAIDGEARGVDAGGVLVVVGPDGACVSSVVGTLDLGDGCALHLQAERGGDADGALVVVDAGLSGEEGCGLDGGAQVVAFGASRFEVDAAIVPTDSAATYCVDGALIGHLDLTVDSARSAVQLVGEVVLDGVSAAGVGRGACR